MRKSITIDDIKNSACGRLNSHLTDPPAPEKKKKSKFGNNKKVVDDIEFHSVGEANRYRQLQRKLKLGHIGILRLQVPYELNPGGKFSYVYIADFVYIDRETGETIVEDFKGWKTVAYNKKKKLMKKVHGIDIKETRGKVSF